jgi:hypothetical protein
MAGLVPAIHAFSLLNFKELDARHINAKTRFWQGELFQYLFDEGVRFRLTGCAGWSLRDNTR